MRDSWACALDFLEQNEIHKKFKHIKQAGFFSSFFLGVMKPNW
jgi:hypothetical protein